MAWSMPAEPRENAPWSWSISRRAHFRDCLRRYYYHYYGYHEGWRDDAPEVARRAYRLRALKSLPLLAGEILHALFAESLRAVRQGAPVPQAAALFEEARRRMNRAWAESRSRAEWERAPKRRTMLHEIYYGNEPSDARIDAVRERLRAACAGFVDSRSLREAASAPFCEIKDVDREGHFDLEGTRVYAMPDLVYRLGDGSFTIVDWKTGGEGEAHALQLAVYALYVRWRIGSAAPILGRVEYVERGRAEEVAIDAAALDAAEREVRDSIAAMRGYLEDPAANRPRPISAFPLRDDRSACPFCNFYEICRPELEGTPVPGPF